MLILIVDRNCIFILSILYISVLAGLYLGAGGINSNVLGLYRVSQKKVLRFDQQ